MHVDSSIGERFELEKTFNRGGEAEIWSLRREPHLVAKLYHHPTAEHEAKLATMIASPPHQANTHPAVAWPLHLLYQKRRFVGYLMPRVGESRPIFHFYNPARRARLATNYPWRYFLHRTAQNLAAAVELIHDRGHVIGDLNESNVLVSREALVTLVDCDSFQVQGAAATNSVMNQLLGRPAPLCTYRSMVGKAEFTPPELQGVDFKSIDRTAAHDNFALAVLLFHLLMEGYHPFAGVMSEETQNDQSANSLGTSNQPVNQQSVNQQSIGRVDLYGIRRGLFPHARNCPIQPPPRAPKLMWLAPELQAAFLRSFVEGYADPDRRPTAKEWRMMLGQAESKLVTCPSADKHVYSNHLRRCPHCERNTVPPPIVLQTAEPPAVTAENTTGVQPAISPWLQKLSLRQFGRHSISWQTYWNYTYQYLVQLGTRRVQLRAHVQQQVIMLLAWLRTLPEQMQQAGTTAHQYAAIWQRWAVGQVIAMPVGGAAALGLYALNDRMADLPLLPFPLSGGWLWAVMFGGFAGILGMSQVWALRTVVLRWSYLREVWVVVTAVTGALLGIIIAGQIDPPLPIAVPNNPAIILPTDLPTALPTDLSTAVPSLLARGSALAVWSSTHLWLCGLTLFFGATLGFLQSFLLRQQLQRAEDGRAWTVTNAVAWLLIIEGALLGIKAGEAWDVTTWQWSNRLVPTAFSSEIGLWLGLLLGGGIGLLAATALTGGVLLWLLQGPRRSVYWSQLMLQLLRTRRFPFRLQRQMRKTSGRWGRALLLLAVIVLMLEGLVAIGWG